MESIRQYIWDAVSPLFLWLFEKFSLLWAAFKTFLEDLFYLPFDGLLTLCETIINAIPVPSAWSNVNPLGSLPGQTLYLLWQCGVIQCILIIGGAYIVRFALNLIPGVFTRV